jgi:hypothetical protein
MSEFSDYMIQKLEHGEQIKTPMDIASELNRATGKYTLEGDIRRDHPSLRDTLPQLPPPEFIDWGNKPKSRANPNTAGQLVDGLVDSGVDMLKHPVATASMLTALPLGFVPGMTLETAGEVADSGYDQAIRLRKQLIENPSDAGHMVRGAGMSVAELPDLAEKHGKSLWKTLTKDFGPSGGPSYKDLHKTFDYERP